MKTEASSRLALVVLRELWFPGFVQGQKYHAGWIVVIAVLLFRSGLVSRVGFPCPFSSSPNGFSSFSGLTVDRRVNPTLSDPGWLA